MVISPQKNFKLDYWNGGTPPNKMDCRLHRFYTAILWEAEYQYTLQHSTEDGRVWTATGWNVDTPNYRSRTLDTIYLRDHWNLLRMVPGSESNTHSQIQGKPGALSWRLELIEIIWWSLPQGGHFGGTADSSGRIGAREGECDVGLWGELV